MRRCTTALAWAFLGQVACNGSSAIDPVDASPPPDAPVPIECRIPESYGDLGEFDQSAWYYGDEPFYWSAPLDQENEVFMWMVLQEKGPFEGGIVPGTFSITGDQLDPATCSICLRLQTASQCYFATGGTVTLTSTADRLAGSMEDVIFAIASCRSLEPLEADCTSEIQQLAFDAELTDLCLECARF